MLLIGKSRFDSLDHSRLQKPTAPSMNPAGWEYEPRETPFISWDRRCGLKGMNFLFSLCNSLAEDTWATGFLALDFPCVKNAGRQSPTTSQGWDESYPVNVLNLTVCPRTMPCTIYGHPLKPPVIGYGHTHHFLQKKQGINSVLIWGDFTKCHIKTSTFWKLNSTECGKGTYST